MSYLCLNFLCFFVSSVVFLDCQGCSFEDELAVVDQSMLPEADMAFLTEQGWEEYVGDKVGVWVCSERQILYVVEQGRILKQYRCSTGLAGMGNVRNSGMTPVGWHTIESKIGGELAAGAVMKGRRWTGEVWQEGMTSDGDLILSRIMWLKGLEAGRNLGGDVDSWGRYIYIHGTNDVAGLGEPKSHGCVRLDPHEVIDLFGRVEEGCRVLITDTDETN